MTPARTMIKMVFVFIKSQLCSVVVAAVCAQTGHFRWFTGTKIPCSERRPQCPAQGTLRAGDEKNQMSRAQFRAYSGTAAVFTREKEEV